MPTPLTFARRTPLRRALDAAGVSWTNLPDAAVADRAGDTAAARSLGIADLSPLPRTGFKGPGTLDAMIKRGVFVDAQPNVAFRQADGGLCLVLGPGEVMLLSNLAGDGRHFAEWETGWRFEDNERTYPLPRRDSHAWFALTGTHVPAMLAKLCGVDMRLSAFPDLSIAQTSLARLSAIIVRADEGQTPVFHVLADSASALYLFSCLTDAAGEFGGRLIGLSAVRELTGS